MLEERGDSLEPARFTYDNLGRLATAPHGPRTSVLAYNGQGNLGSLTDLLGHLVSFDYDPVGRITRQNVRHATKPSQPYVGLHPLDLEAAYLPPELEAGPTPTHYAYNLDRRLV